MRSVLTVVGLLLPTLVLAQAPERTHDIVPSDYASVAMITQIVVSPDGKHVAYTEARWDKTEDNRRTDLWIVATDGKTSPRRLTGERANDRNPKWSAEGESIYVLANRKRAGETKPPYDDTTQVWKVPVASGEPQPITRIPGGIVAFDYSPQGNTLAYSVDASTTDEDVFTKLRAKYPAEYGHGKRKVSEVWKLDLSSWRAEKIVDEKRYVREFSATRDGKRIAMITAPDDQVINSEGKSRVDVWDAKGNKVTTTDMNWMKTAASPYPWLESLAWVARGGDAFAYCAIFDAHPAEIMFVDMPADGWTTKKLRRLGGYHVRGYGSSVNFPDATYLQYISEAKATNDILIVAPKREGDGISHNHVYSQGGSSILTLDVVSPEYRTYISAAVRSSPDSLVRLDTNANPKGMVTLADPNPHTPTWKFPSIQHITWKAPDGTEVGGVLELPPGYKKGDKLPLVVAIHGGPTTSAKAELTFDPHNGRLYFAAKGYAVLCPNYRGSTGYGDKFVTDLIGRENDIEVNDIIAGVQHLVKEGIADPERVGVMGWSNGGYLTNCLITRTDLPFKLKAASSGAGIVDSVAEWGFNDEPAYPIVFKKGLPWETPEIYRKTSPTYDLGKAKVPTLIHVGGNDERCPPGHSRMLYRALKEYNKVPTELVVYPGEPHGLSKLSHRITKMEWDLAWFEKYLK